VCIRKLCQCLVEPPDESLVRAEDNGSHRSRIRPTLTYGQGARLGTTETCGQPDLHSTTIVIQRLDRVFVLADARGGQRFHRTHNPFKVLGAGDLSMQTLSGAAHGGDFAAPFAPAAGLKQGERLRGQVQCCLAVRVAHLVG
jgi:hypothetical protein